MDRLLDFFKPHNYQIFLDIDKHKKILHGRVIISGISKQNVAKFHAKNFTIEKVMAGEKTVEYTYEQDVISIETEPDKLYVFTIHYRTPLRDNMEGAYLSTYNYGDGEERIVATQFEPHYASACFPCVDEPSAKATFELIISVPDKEDTVLSNMPAKKTKQFTSENVVKFTTFFEKTPVMSTYLLAFVVGKFHRQTTKSSHGVKITTYCPLNHDPKILKYANAVAAGSLDYFDDVFGVPYPLKKLDQVAIPDFEAGAMENWGLVTYRESCLLVDKNSSLDAKKSVAITIAHELSHQWFGNLVTMKWWNDLWLNESFASVMEYYAVDMMFPKYHIWEDFFTGDCLAALRRDALDGVQAVKQEVRDPEEISILFDGAIVYAKGAHLLLMLIRMMGEKKFFASMKKYFKDHRYGNTTSDDLWAALQKNAKFDVKKLMNSWILQPGFPMIKDGEQKRFTLSGEPSDAKWILPEIKDDMSGHYIINYSDKEFAEKLDKFSKLSLEQRLRLLVDRSMLAKTEHVPAASLIPLLSKFENEKSAAVWEVIAAIISDLKIFFEPGSEDEAKFKKFVKNLIASKIRQLGIVPKSVENSDNLKIRPILLSLAIYARDKMILEQMANLYQTDYGLINPEIRTQVICANLIEHEELINDYILRYQSESKPEAKADLLFAIAQVKEPKNVEKLIALLERPDIVKPQDRLYLFIYLRRNAKAKHEVLDWLFEHWDYLIETNGDQSADDFPRYAANTIIDQTESDKFFGFFMEKIDKPAIAHTIKIAKTEVKSRINLIATDKPAILKQLI